MSWRIHFTEADLRRVQVHPPPGPMAETLLAFSFLRCPNQPRGLFRSWHDRSMPLLTPAMRPLAVVMPSGTRGPDFFTLTGEAPTIEQGIKALLAAPREAMMAELESFDEQRRLPREAWAIAEAESAARHDLADAVLAAYQAFVEPYWSQISGQLRAVQASRRRILATGGPEQLLASLQSRQIRWRPPVLEVLGSAELDLYLDGTGLALVPSLFAGKLVSLHFVMADPLAPPWLVLPWTDGPEGFGLSAPPRDGGPALGALVGRTRATVLAGIGDGRTTTELAGQCGISLAAASQHATVLRNAGLVVTRRHGNAVLHTLTPLGEQLLGQQSQQASGRSPRADPE
jgi:DNA-binding transcriptional ArsR family regulator